MEELIENSRSYAVGVWAFIPVVAVLFECTWTTYVSALLDSTLSYLLRNLLLFILLIVTTYVVFRGLLPEYRRVTMLSVGLVWSVLWMVFDTLYRHFVLNLTLDAILQDYFPWGYGPRSLVLLVMFFGPVLAVRTPTRDPDLFEMPLGKMATIGLLPSSLKIAYYRRKGAQIGEGVRIGPLSVLDCKRIVIGDHAEIGAANMIRANEFRLGRYSKLGMLVIIDTYKAFIGDQVTIQEQVYIGGLKTDKSVIEIGDLSMVFSQSVINPTHPVKIGKRVGIGGSNYLFTHGTWQPVLDGFPVAFGPITIEDGVWFPWRVFVLPNVHIGKEATIGAGSVINKDIPARCLAAGVPAKVLRREEEHIKKYTDSEKREILKDMLVELVGYLRIEDWKVSDPVLENAYAMTSFRTPRGPSSKRDNHIFFMFEDRSELWDMVSERAFVVTLFAIAPERIKSLEKVGSWWYDLASSTWGGTRTNVSLVIYGWLSRYGHWLMYTS